jgi:putative Mg2+ transporter-C (MgtC) family protein
LTGAQQWIGCASLANMLLSVITSWESAFSHWAGSFSWPIEGLLRLLLAGICGGLMGVEREIRGREAGFRTYILVCLGSAVVMIVSIEFATHAWQPQTPNLGVNINVDPARIAYGVMTGVGFLGAGTILHNKASIRGLTTAAGLWCAAAVGLAAGFGMYTMTIIATLLVLAALSVLNYFEDFLPRTRYRTVSLRIPWETNCVAELVRRLQSAGFHVADASFHRVGHNLSETEVHVHIAFQNKDAYLNLATKLASDSSITVLGIHEG